MNNRTMQLVTHPSHYKDEEAELIRGLERQNEKLRQMYLDLTVECQQLKQQLLGSRQTVEYSA